MQTASLSLKYKGINTEFHLGQQVFFWRDARQPDLVKVRWLGPAHIVMKEHKNPQEANSPVSVYWLAFKSQLIRCAPHHIRPDIKAVAHSLDDTQEALNKVRQLKSRGVTRYYDLHQLNRRNLMDVEEDEHGESENLHSESDHEMAPPRQRLRLSMAPPEASADSPTPDGEPGQPAAPPPAPEAPSGEPTPADTAQTPAAVPIPPSEISLSEPSEEPPALSAAPTPHGAPPQGVLPNSTAQVPQLDPATAALYETAGPETFEQRRRRFSQQETLSFAPWRTNRPALPEPYMTAPPPATTPAESANMTYQDTEHGFNVEGLDASQLPTGWQVDEHGYMTLSDTPADCWEVKAGCLIRHHLVPRRGRLHLDHLPKDCPIPADRLDKVKVTLVHTADGKSRLHTDDGTETSPPPDTTSSWTGCTIFQIDGSLRKEMAMYSGQHTIYTSAKQEAKSQKMIKAKKFKKDKNGVNERALGPHDRALFKEAKVKELKSFFDHGVWTFQHKNDADETRTLTARMILKWSKNPDGSPRAKARLIVRGYNDPDALAGQIVTSSPTTTRLSRSYILSLAANMGWSTWTADVSTAFLQGRPQSRKLWVKLPTECLQLLGADEDTRMLLLKPCYGQIDAPRGWFLEAVDRLLRAGLRQHPLDPCCFLAFETDSPNYDAQDPVHQTVQSLGDERLVGMIIMHVDDMLGSGCLDSPRYQEVVRTLKDTFSFREWKQDLDKLEYCGCELTKTKEGGRRLHQEAYMGKVSPITFNKGRALTEALNEREITQVRGLLGSVQWPAVQTSPHLQCSTSMLSSQVNKATVHTLHECNRLLKFCKENKDIGLIYNHIGEPQQVQMITFFDAGFGSRPDGNSQGGYVIMLVNKALLTSSEEGQYHILDWRSFRTPRVARSSLGAEAQAGGQAADATEFTCRFWEHLLHPALPLQDLLKVKSQLTPQLITDAKALYDSYHREGISSSVIDKRISLELRVMKERMQDIGGSLRWVSSERQLGDGFTKESARALLAARLRHGRIKLTWDPSYTAAKRKTKAERHKAIAESTEHYRPEEPPDFDKPAQNEHTVENELSPDTKNTQEFFDALEDSGEPENTELCEYVHFAQNNPAPTYVFLASHVAYRKHAMDTGRMKNVLKWLVWWSMMVATAGETNTCPTTEAPEEQDSLWFWILVLAAVHVMALFGMFILGRCTKFLFPPARHDVSTQKDEAVVPQRLRQLNTKLQADYDHGLRQVEESKKAAQEARAALALQEEELDALRNLCLAARDLFRNLEAEMEDHAARCPFTREIYASKRGECWHLESCHLTEQITEKNMLVMRRCPYCAGVNPPPDRMLYPQGWCIRHDVHHWYRTFEQYSSPSM